MNSSLENEGKQAEKEKRTRKMDETEVRKMEEKEEAKKEEEEEKDTRKKVCVWGMASVTEECR